VITGFSRSLGKLETRALRSSLRKLDFSYEVVDQFLADVENNQPRHPLMLFQTGMPEQSADINVTIRALERSGFNARICTCTGQGIESELENAPPPKDSSVELLDREIRGETAFVKATMELVRESLLVTEKCEWVSEASVRVIGEEAPGCLVLTDQNYWVGYWDISLSMAFADSVQRVSDEQILRLRGRGREGVFRIDGLAVQSITLSKSEFLDLEECVRLSEGTGKSSGRVIGETHNSSVDPESRESGEQSGATGALDAMRELQAMLDAGFISDDEFQSKKADILKRL